MKHDCGGRAPSPRRLRDRGATFVEVLVALVLLGTAVGGTLTALRTTIVSGRRDEGQTKAHAWLLAVEDALYRAPYYACVDPGPGPDGPDPDDGIDAGEIAASYEAAINAAPRPADWATAIVDIPNLQFWRKSDGVHVWDPICSTDPSVRRSAQLVTVYILSPSRDVGKTIQVVKDGG
jgi:hypothetical protein